MDVAAASFILGYHGCDQSVAERVLAGDEPLRFSENDYDWLGDGIYFWEHNAQRAYDFAVAMAKRPHPSGQRVERPAVVGAIIDLRNCLNLLNARHIQMVARAHQDLAQTMERIGEPLPTNSGGPDLVNRKLDCAVIRLLHQQREETGEVPFDTVRAAFFEGRPLYDNAGFASANHIQVCVREHGCVVGYFRPLAPSGRPIRFGG